MVVRLVAVGLVALPHIVVLAHTVTVASASRNFAVVVALLVEDRLDAATAFRHFGVAARIVVGTAYRRFVMTAALLVVVAAFHHHVNGVAHSVAAQLAAPLEAFRHQRPLVPLQGCMTAAAQVPVEPFPIH